MTDTKPLFNLGIEVPWFVHAVAASMPVALALTYKGHWLYRIHVISMSFVFLLVIPEGIILAVRAIKVCMHS